MRFHLQSSRFFKLTCLKGCAVELCEAGRLAVAALAAAPILVSAISVVAIKMRKHSV